MARRGQSAAFLRALRRKHGLGEFAAGKTRTKRARARKTRRKRRKRPPAGLTSGQNGYF